jgi:enduracididine biosynthesis enzyme MppR
MIIPYNGILNGYSLPLSPAGNSAMIPAPPWHFAGEALWITYRVDPDAAAAFLPSRLRPGPDPGAAAIGFFDWQWCSDSGAELCDPVRAQFKECLIVLDCMLDDQPVARVPYAWVDSAVPLVRGFIQGMPKMFGSVWLTRSFPVGRAGLQRKRGAHFGGTVAAHDQRIASATITIADTVGSPPPLSDRPLAHTRHFPAWHPGEKAMEELVMAKTSNVEFSDIWRGEATLLFSDSADADLAALAPVEIGQGYLFSYAETLEPGRRV